MGELKFKRAEVMNSIEYLKLKQIQFKKINLAAIPKTANDVVKIYGCPLEQVLKTLVFIGRKEVIVVLQGDKKVNFKKLNLIIDDNYNKLRMATHKEIKKIFYKDIGNLDPFIKSEGCIKILDKKIFTMNIANMGGGIPGIGIEMKTKELKKAWNGMIEDISK